MLLTDTKIKAAKPKAKDYKLKDGRGLYLLVKNNGTKHWRMRYTLGKENMLSFGTYPEVALTEARNKREEARRLIAKGSHPKGNTRSGDSFESVAREWHKLNKPKWSEATADVRLKRLEKYLFPELGYKRVQDIRPLDLLKVIKESEATGNTHMAHRLLQMCQGIYAQAIIYQKVEFNPASNLVGALQPHKSKSHPALKEADLPDFCRALEKSKGKLQTKIATKLLLLTFLRTGALRHSEWSHIKEDWHVPGAIMKMSQDHIVPITPQIRKLLDKLKELNPDSKYLFPNKGKHPVMSENTINSFLRDIGYDGKKKPKVVGHGFRTLASTIIHESALFYEKAIDKQLSHEERNKTKAVYNKAEYLEERRKIMRWWNDFLVKRGLVL